MQIPVLLQLYPGVDVIENAQFPPCQLSENNTSQVSNEGFFDRETSGECPRKCIYFQASSRDARP